MAKYRIDCFCYQCRTSFISETDNNNYNPTCPKCKVMGSVRKEVMAPLRFELPAPSPYDRPLTHYWNGGAPI